MYFLIPFSYFYIIYQKMVLTFNITKNIIVYVQIAKIIISESIEISERGSFDLDILLITTISGFLPKFLMQDVQMLQEMGYTVHYASNFQNPVYECDRQALEEEGIVCHDIPIAKSPLDMKANLTALQQLNKIVDQYEIAAIHCNNPVGGVLGRLTSGRHRKPYVIYTAHGFHFYHGAPAKNWMIYYPAERFLAHRTNQLITINHEDKTLSERFRLRKHGSTTRIPGVGLDTQRFLPRIDMRAEYRKKIGLDEGCFVFLAVGELNNNKNHRTIIKAFSRIRKKNAKLLICGEGPCRGELQELIAELKLSEQVMLCGYQTRIEEYYQSADCFMFPSVREGLGMAAVEAMACGLPLIVGDNRGTREYAFENAIVCAPMDEEAFSEGMRKVMSDRKCAAAMGQKSLEIAAEFAREKTAGVIMVS